MERQIVCGGDYVTATLPDHTQVVSPGLSLPVEPAGELGAEIQRALAEPLDTPPLRALVRPGARVTLAFDDATVPCYAPVWATAIPLILKELDRGGVPSENVELVCANALHRKFTHSELARLIGEEIVAANGDRLRCHDAEDADALVHLGKTTSGYDVEVSSSVTDADLTIYLNCSTTRGFSGGWKSVCVGLSSYRSIHHHHTPDIMSMSLDGNRMHEMLDEMGALVERELGRDRVFKLETLLANPLAVHRIFSGTVGATRARVLEEIRARQKARRDLVEEPFDVVVYGVPDWSPYAAFSHGNPILDLISTGLGYLGGMIEALGKPGCTVVLVTPCPDRWDEEHHPSYREVWEEVLPTTRDPVEARDRFEPEFARREDYIERYRHGFGFHPVHGIMALYPLKRLRHAGRVIVAQALDPSIPAHCGFET
ncbi:MAG TPA: lactate racemase domain-containing protein, partial [Actinomycetota bacterium]|nr:lactate racemase domain-containing protein [Actinomycetota bacterium]